MNPTTHESWHQEPWVWFNIVLLVIAVAAASWMAFVAIKHTPAELSSRWYDEGVLVKQMTQNDRYIVAIGLQGVLHVNVDQKITFNIKTNTKLSSAKLAELTPQNLLLFIEHPVNPNLDQTITLTKTNADTYSGKLLQPLIGKNYLLVSEQNNKWSLAGMAYFPSHESLVLALR